MAADVLVVQAHVLYSVHNKGTCVSHVSDMSYLSFPVSYASCRLGHEMRLVISTSVLHVPLLIDWLRPCPKLKSCLGGPPGYGHGQEALPRQLSALK